MAGTHVAVAASAPAPAVVAAEDLVVQKQRISPEYRANFVSHALFHWVQPFIRAGNDHPLREEDLYAISEKDSVNSVSVKFEELLKKYSSASSDKNPVRQALVEQFRVPMIKAGVVKALNSTANFGTSLLLSRLLSALPGGGEEEPSWVAYSFSVALFLLLCLRTIIENNYFHRCVRVGFQIRAAITTAVYRKSLRMSPVARQDTPVGKIVNLMQLDANKLESLMMQLHVTWDSVYQIAGYMVLLGVFVGWSALAGLATMILLIPFQMVVMRKMSARRVAVARATDQRIKVTNEALQGVRTLKQYNWEDAYVEVISRVRDTELDAIWRYSLIGTINSTIMQTAPLVVGIVTLLVFAASGGDFTASRVFSALTVLGQLRFPLMFLPMIVQQLADAKVSLARLHKFLREPEVELFAKSTAPPPPAPSPPAPSHVTIVPPVGSTATPDAVTVAVAAESGAAEPAPPVATPTTTEASAAALVVDTSSPLEGSDTPFVGTPLAPNVPSTPAPFRQPIVALSSLAADQVGIAITGATFYHEEPAVRRARLAAAAEEAARAAEAAAKKAAKSKKAAKPAPAAAAATVPAAASPSAAGALPASPSTTKVAAASKSADLPPVLRNVDVVVPKGALYAVIGPVGSGKSSLCAGILGELHRAMGQVSVQGRIAYVAQTAWILNASVKRNITFAGDATTGSVTDEERYARAVAVSQMRSDVAILPAGDATEIGERGVNLSGGQRQRVSIARAAYANADVYLFDDPLSALDAEVGKSVFEQCITGELAGKTRLLITNQLQYLRQCDGVIALGVDEATGSGYIRYQGRFADLMASVPDFANLMSMYGHKQEEAAAAATASSTEGSDATSASPSAPASSIAASTPIPSAAEATPAAPDSSASAAAPTASSKAVAPDARGDDVAKPVAAPASSVLMTVEEKSEGAVKAEYYWRYLRATRNATLFVILVVMAYTLSQMGQIVSQWWITFWTSDSSYIKNPRGFYMGIYVALGVAVAITGFVRVVSMAIMGIRASRSLHHDILERVLRAPQAFFDTTPLGRILARFSKDLDAIDNLLISNLGMLVMCIFFIIGSLGAIIFATPWFALIVVPVLVIYVLIMNYFRNVAREAKRYESISRSPIYAHFSETLNGLSTIRAYGLVHEFSIQNEGKLARNISASYTLKSCDRWLSIRLELLGNFIILAAALLACGTAYSRSTGTAASLAGFSLSYALSITSMFTWTVRTFAETEQTMNSVERVLYYKDYIPQEPYDPPVGAAPLPDNWPSAGTVEFRGYRMQYRPNTPEVLHGISLAVRGGEKIGVVGRTGAGKSSIMQALFRMTEMSCHSGQILIDGVDIDTLGLNQLRSQLAIIPQDPVMFSGTVRTNLDPVGRLKAEADGGDARMWDALDKVGLKAVVMRAPGGLDAPVTEYGENWSAGVLLRNTRVVLLDEASSALDHETDLSIQRAIREAFQSSTMLIIAHRLNTIISCDRVLVMSAGEVAEFAHPHELLTREGGSMFASLVDETGADASAALRAAAQQAYETRVVTPPVTAAA